MKTKEKIITSWHFSMVFLGLVMGIRLGSSWSLPFYHLIYTAILFPLISQAILNIGISQEEIRFGKAPFLPLLGYLFIMGFWSSAIESHQSPHLSGNWLWLAAMAIHLTVLIGKKRGNFSKKRLRTYLWATFWGLSEISIIFIAMGNLLSGFARFRSIWVCLGVIGNVFSMEMLLTLFKDYKENNGEKSQNHSSLAMLLTFVMLLIATITTFLGVLIPYVINIYDPLSSYVTMGLAVVNIFITIIPFLHYRLSKK